MPNTTNKGYTVPTYGSFVGTWGDEINNNFTSIVDANMAGIVSVSLSSSNVTLSASQAQNLVVSLSGTLTSSVTVSTPCKGFFWVINNTTGNFSVTLQANFGSGAVGSSFIIPQGASQLFISDATNGLRYGAAPPSLYLPGELKPYAGTSAPTGWLLCYGQAVNRVLYAGLYAVIGETYGSGDGYTTFNVPDLRGRTLAGLDNMGGSDAGRLSWANALGTTGGSQTHTMTSDEMPSHAHEITDPGHKHLYQEANWGAGAASGGTTRGLVNSTPLISADTDTKTTGITVDNTGGGSAFDIMQPTILCNWLIKT